MFTEKNALLSLLGPTADGFAGTVDSDAFSMENFDEATIVVSHKGGTTGKSTLTVLASSDASGTGAAAVAFAYRRKTTGASSVWGAVSQATVSGIDTVPGEDTLIEIYVRSSELPDGKPFVNLHAVEAVNDPVTASVFAILSSARYAGTTLPDSLS
jgi:hypothetical protein